MKKIKLTESDIDKARLAFKLLHGTMLPDRELFSKGMLRALERKGLVERVGTFGQRKYIGVTPTMRYVWIWRNREEMGHASAASPENKG